MLCKHGHTIQESNTYTSPDGKKHCRVCRGNTSRAFDLANPDAYKLKRAAPLRHPLDLKHKVIDKFWGHVTVSSGCWLYDGTNFNRWGYKCFQYDFKRYPAHRISYQLLKGDIPDDYVVDHLCRVTNCVNPDHLEAVTNHENVVTRGIKSASGINSRKTECIHGHPFDEVNIRINSNGSRHCKECGRKRWRAKRIEELRRGA